MKTRCLPILLVLLPLAALCAQNAKPKLAVLPMATSEKIETDLLVNVPEAISEELLRSRLYTILDRTSVDDTLKELQHQLSSGLVNEVDMKKAGDLLSSQLGAELIVSIKVSYTAADRTYSLSAKIVKIRGSEIIAQESDKQAGTPSVLLDIAHRVGRKLAGSAAEAPKTPAVAAPPAKTPVVTDRTPAPASGPKARITANYVIPIFGGDIQDAMDRISAGDTSSTYGFSVHYLQPLFLGIYVSGVMDYAAMDLESTATYSSHSLLDLQAGAGWSFILDGWLQFYAGVMAGWGNLTLGDYWVLTGTSGTTQLSGTTGSGFCLSFEAGADVILADHWTLAMRISVAGADVSSGEIYDRDLFQIGSTTATGLVVTGIHIGAGYAF